jgi:hypothetical protein
MKKWYMKRKLSHVFGSHRSGWTPGLIGSYSMPVTFGYREARKRQLALFSSEEEARKAALEVEKASDRQHDYKFISIDIKKPL